MTNHYLELAKKRNLLITIGSDFHGKTKPSIHLGQFEIGQEVDITQKILAQL